jgi:hypothetical protein
MGLVHRVRKECSDGEFLVENLYTGELTPVRVDPDKSRLYEDTGIFAVHPEACPFLRFDPDQKAFCTVHLTRPSICRDFGCWRILILDSDGNRAGRIIFQYTLMTDDAAVKRIWDEYRDRLDRIDPGSQDKELVEAFTGAGYVVRV